MDSPGRSVGRPPDGGPGSGAPRGWPEDRPHEGVATALASKEDGLVTPQLARFAAPTCLAAGILVALPHPGRADGHDPAEIRRHIVSTVNDGALSPDGPWAQTPEDIQRIFLEDAVGAAEAGSPRIHLYSHGGMTGEGHALQQVPRLLDTFAGSGVYPVAFIWRSDVWSTISNIFREAIGREDAPEPGAERWDGFLEFLTRWMGGKALWDEMKENIERSDQREDGGVRLATEALAELHRRDPGTEIHLTGYSAGSILMGHMIHRLTALHGVPVASCTLLAPAMTVDLFMETIAPALESGALDKVRVFLLDDAHERDDSVYLYGKSVLYLVRNAFEKERYTPLLGMEIAPSESPELAELIVRGKVEWILTPNRLPVGHPLASGADSHGAYGRDEATYQAIRRAVEEASSRGASPGD